MERLLRENQQASVTPYTRTSANRRSTDMFAVIANMWLGSTCASALGLSDRSTQIPANPGLHERISVLGRQEPQRLLPLMARSGRSAKDDAGHSNDRSTPLAVKHASVVDENSSA